MDMKKCAKCGKKPCNCGKEGKKAMTDSVKPVKTNSAVLARKMKITKR